MLSPQKLLVSFHLIALVQAFEFQIQNPPTQCDSLTVTWSGGQPPFSLLIFKPFNGPVENISIPSTAYQNSQGLFSTTLEVARDKQVLISMSDVTGITSGGILAPWTVGPSLSNISCNLTEPAQDFVFTFDSSVVQCKPYSFEVPNSVTQPISVLVVVSLGQAFIVHAPIGGNFTWGAANVTAGSNVMFFVDDALGRTGGSSHLFNVEFSDDASCISASAITSSSIPSNTLGGQTSGTNTSLVATSHSSSHVAVIVGATAGGLVALVLVIFFLWCKHRKPLDSESGRNAPRESSLTSELTRPSTLSHAGHLPYSHYSTTPTAFDHNHLANIPRDSRNTALSTTSDEEPLSITPPSHNQNNERLPTSIPSRQIKERRGIIDQSVSDGPSAVRDQGSTHSSRVVIHTDIEDSGIMEVVELPPKYLKDRAPIPGFAASESSLSRRAQAQ